IPRHALPHVCTRGWHREHPTLGGCTAAKEQIMKRFLFSVLALVIGLGSARGQDPDPVRRQIELVRQQMFLEIHSIGTTAQIKVSNGESALAVSTWQSQTMEQASTKGRAEIQRLLNGVVKPTPLSEKRAMLVGVWRGTSMQPNGTARVHQLTVDANSLMAV